MLAILLSASFVSCKDEVEENINGSQSKGGVIGFNAFQDGFQKPTTRAVIDKIDQLNEIYVLSMKQKAPGNWEQVFKNDAGTGIDVLTLSNSGNLIWNYSPVENWEDGYSYKFRAFYPQTFNTSAGESCTNGFEYAKPLNGSTALTLNNYKSAQDPRNNTDLLVSKEVTRAYTTAEGNDEPVPLKMEHLLSCVNFNFKGPEGKEVHVTDFSIAGYVDKGTCTYDKGAKWSTQGASGSGSFSAIKVDVEFNGQTGNVSWNEGGSRVVFRDDRNDMEIPPAIIFDNSGARNNDYANINPKYGNGSYTQQYIGGNDNYGHFYIEMDVAESDPLATPTGPSTNVSITSCENLLFIPQPVLPYKEQQIDMEITMKRVDWGNQVSTYTVPGVSVAIGLYANISYYFDNNKNEIQHAIISDLTGNGKVPEWEAGVKYNYTIGLYEYQATANITIEDWTHHTYEEELK